MKFLEGQQAQICTCRSLMSFRHGSGGLGGVWGTTSIEDNFLVARRLIFGARRQLKLPVATEERRESSSRFKCLSNGVAAF